MDSDRSIELLCFPYAGAGASVYLRWRRLLPSWIHVIPVELPGHGRRSQEPLCQSMVALVEILLREPRHHSNRPFALFGHSLGALVAFEYGFQLQSRGAKPPCLLIASGAHAPSHDRSQRTAALHTDEELHEELRSLAGTPTAALADAELMELVLPVLRADFKVAGSYARGAPARLSCPIQAFAGTGDNVTSHELSAWRDHTDADFSLALLPGGHFFIHERERELLALVERSLSRSLERTRRHNLSAQRDGESMPAPERVDARETAAEL